MSAKTSADVLIGGKIYTLSGYESEDYLQKVANYINNKINEFDEMEQFRRFPVDMKSTLVELNIADDYFKAKEQAQKLDQDVKEKEKELYELKHELISARIKVESSEKTAAELEKENRQLLLHKAKLEAALEDALLGKVKGQAQAGTVSATQKEYQSDNRKPLEEDKNREGDFLHYNNAKENNTGKDQHTEPENTAGTVNATKLENTAGTVNDTEPENTAGIVNVAEPENTVGTVSATGQENGNKANDLEADTEILKNTETGIDDKVSHNSGNNNGKVNNAGKNHNSGKNNSNGKNMNRSK